MITVQIIVANDSACDERIQSDPTIQSGPPPPATHAEAVGRRPRRQPPSDPRRRPAADPPHPADPPPPNRSLTTSPKPFNSSHTLLPPPPPSLSPPACRSFLSECRRRLLLCDPLNTQSRVGGEGWNGSWRSGEPGPANTELKSE